MEKKKFKKKKNIEPIFGKVNEGDEIIKNIGHISGKVIEGDEIKNTFDLIQKKVMRATKKKQAKKNIAGKIFFIF